jgi:hypothetical protein
MAAEKLADKIRQILHYLPNIDPEMDRSVGLQDTIWDFIARTEDIATSDKEPAVSKWVEKIMGEMDPILSKLQERGFKIDRVQLPPAGTRKGDGPQQEEEPDDPSLPEFPAKKGSYGSAWKQELKDVMSKGKNAGDKKAATAPAGLTPDDARAAYGAAAAKVKTKTFGKRAPNPMDRKETEPVGGVTTSPKKTDKELGLEHVAEWVDYYDMMEQHIPQ